MRALAFALSLPLVGCADNVLDLYQSHRDAALAEPGPLPASWDPEISVVLSPTLVSTMLKTSLDRSLRDVEPIDVRGVARVTPRAEVKRIELVETDCKECIGFRAKVQGKARIVAGRLDHEVPFEGRIRASLRFESSPADNGRMVTAKLTKVERFELDAEGPRGLSLDLDRVMGEWAEDLVARVPGMEVAEVGGDDIPIRDLRLLPSGRGLRLDLLTTAAAGEPLKVKLAPPDDGWLMAVSEGTMLSFARRAAFEEGEISMDVHAEPMSLDLDGAGFKMGLRLWRLSGSGWWRDYEVSGGVALTNKLVRLTPTGVVEVGASKGAALADPLAALGQSLILKSIEEAAAQAIPVTAGSVVDGLHLNVVVSGVEGREDALVVSGTATVRENARSAPTRTNQTGSSSSGDRRGTSGSTSGGKKPASGAKTR